MSKLIIGFAGEIGSGKTFSTKYLSDKYQAESHRFSTSLRDVLDRIYLEKTRENLAELSRILRQSFGENILAKIIANDALHAKSELVVIDGVRRLEDISELQKLPQFKFVYIEAKPETRFSRLTKRGENADDNSKTWEQFLADHKLETELEIPLLKAHASVVIQNDGDLETLKKNLEALVTYS